LKLETEGKPTIEKNGNRGGICEVGLWDSIENLCRLHWIQNGHRQMLEPLPSRQRRKLRQ
jgi:hypothetical protein